MTLVAPNPINIIITEGVGGFSAQSGAQESGRVSLATGLFSQSVRGIATADFIPSGGGGGGSGGGSGQVVEAGAGVPLFSGPSVILLVMLLMAVGAVMASRNRGQHVSP
jgi:hypothetical protein